MRIAKRCQRRVVFPAPGAAEIVNVDPGSRPDPPKIFSIAGTPVFILLKKRSGISISDTLTNFVDLNARFIMWCDYNFVVIRGLVPL